MFFINKGMPRYFRRRGRFARRGRFRRRKRFMPRLSNLQMASMLAKRAWSGVKYIKGLVNSEKHVFESNLTTAVDSAGVINGLISVAQGDTNITRSGNSIFCRKLVMRGSYLLHASATSTVIRYIIFVDNQQVSDTAPAVTAVLAAADVDSMLNVGNWGRFQLLLDRTIVLDSNYPKRYVKHVIPMKHHVRFNGAAASDNQKGTFYILQISDEATNTPTPNLTFQTYFYDN